MRTGAPRRRPARRRARMSAGRRASPVLGIRAVGPPHARLAAAVQSVVHVRPPASGGAQDHDRCRGRGRCWCWSSAACVVVAALERADHARSRHALADLGDRAESRQPLSRRGRRHAARARRAGPHRAAAARHRAARRRRRHGRGGAEGRGRHFRHEPADGEPARRKLPPGRRQHDDPDRSGWADQRAGRRRAAVRHRSRRMHETQSDRRSHGQPPAPAPPSSEQGAAGQSARVFRCKRCPSAALATNVTALLAWIDELGKLGLDAEHRRLRWPGVERDRHHQRQPDHRRPPRRHRVEAQPDQPESEPPEGGRRGADGAVGEPGAALGR